jgi:hypothetical protein
MLNLESVVVADPAILSTPVGDEVVLLDATSSKYFTFESVGADIWRQLDQPLQVREMCETLAAIYAAPDDRIHVSVLSFLSDLLERRLIKLA